LSNDKTQGEVHSDELEVCVNKANTQIAFISNWNKVPTPGMGDFEIYVAPLQFIGGVPRLLNPDTTDWKQLTTNTRDDRSPDFSPNGGTIAYATKINGQFDIYTVLTGTPGAPFRVTASYANDEAPAYDRMSPLGTKLYYMSNRAGGGNYEIFYINPTQQESSFNLPVRITFNAGFDGYPASSLAGDLAFATETWGASEIMRYNGVDFFRLTENNAIDTYPSYSPDGKWITFMSNRVDTQFDIFRMPYDGGDATRLTNNSAPDIDPYYGGQP
jgi:Tol biopolymer transport system component